MPTGRIAPTRPNHQSCSIIPKDHGPRSVNTNSLALPKTKTFAKICQGPAISTSFFCDCLGSGGIQSAEDYVAGGRTPGHSWEQSSDGEQFIIRVPIEKPINFKRDVKFELKDTLGSRRGNEMRIGVDRITSISLVVHETTYLCGNLAGQVHIADNEFACAVQRGASGKTTGIVVTLDLPHRLDSMVVKRICKLPQTPKPRLSAAIRSWS